MSDDELKARPRRLSSNLIANLIRFSAIALVSFFQSPYIVGKLGAAGYGVWTLAVGLTGSLGLLDFGVRQAVNRFVAHHHAVAEHEESSNFVTAGLKLFLIAACAAFVLSLGLAWLAPRVFNIPEALLRESQWVIVLSGGTVAFALISGVFGGVVSGMQRFDVQCGIDVGVTLLRALGFIVVLELGYGIIGMAYASLAASALALLSYRTAASRLYVELKVVLLQPLGPYAGRLLKFAASFFVIHVLNAIAFQSDNIIIGILMPIEAIAFYAIAVTLVKQSSGVTDAIAHIMTPRISAFASKGEPVADDIMRVAQTSLLLIAPVAITLFVRGESFIRMWMSDQYAVLSGQVLQVLSVVLFVGATRSIVFHSLAGLGLHRKLIPGIAIESFVNVLLSIILIQRFGIVGVAFGTLVPNVIVSLLYFPICLRNATGIKLQSLYFRAVALPTLAATPFAVVTYLLEERIGASNLWVFFFQTGLLLPLVPVAAWFICADSEDKSRVLSMLNIRRRGGAKTS